MLYLDCSEYLEKSGSHISALQRRGVEYGVIWQNGEDFMLENTIRMNLALPESRLLEALERLEKYVFV